MRKCFWVVMGLSALMLFGCSSSDKVLSEQEYLEQAKDSLDQGKYNDAIIQLKNAVKINPNSAEGRYLLGELYVNVGLGSAAEKELQRAGELGVAGDAIVLLMGDALLQQGKADDVIKNYQVKETDPVQIKLNNSIVLAEAHFQKNDFAAAKEWFTKAQVLSAESERAALGLARIAIVDRDYGRAQSLIDSATGGTGKQSQRAWITLADLKRAQNSPEEIIAAYKQSAELSKSKQDYFYLVAMRGLITEYLQQNNPGKAETELNTLKKSFYKEQFPDNAELNHIRATLAYEQKKYDVAADLAGKVLKVDENNPGATLLMGAIRTIQGQSEQAEVHLTKFLSQVPNNIMARKLLAHVQMSRGHSDAAVDTLTPIVKGTTPDSEILALIAGASLRAGEPRKSAEYYQQAIDKNAGNSDLRAGLAQSYVGMGEFEKAIAELNKLKGEEGKFFAAELGIAETRIKEKNYPAALESLKSLEKSDAANPLPVSLQGTVYSLMGNDAKAKAEFQRALKVKPGYGPAARSLALFELRAGNNAAAKQLYESVIKESPKEFAIFYDYAQMEMGAGQYKHAEELLKKAQEQDKDKTKSAVLLARLNLKQNNPSGALSELRAVSDTKNAAVLAEMGNAQMMLKEYVNAKNSYKKLTEIERNSALAYYLLYTAQLASGELKEANSSLNTSLQKDGKYIPSLIASVSMALNDNALPTAREKLKKLETLTPASDAVALLKADLAMREQKFPQAITLYGDLYKRNPNADLAQKLGQAYWTNGDKKAALSVLTDAAKQQPKSSKLQYAVATAYQDMGDAAHAIESYKAAIRLDNQNVAALNNLAWLLKDSDLAKAREYAEKASELAPGNKAVKDTLAEITKRQGR
jgi:putative PEP-CTERM system TPR-repeat lipoprotein